MVTAVLALPTSRVSSPDLFQPSDSANGRPTQGYTSRYDSVDGRYLGYLHHIVGVTLSRALCCTTSKTLDGDGLGLPM